MSGRIPGQVYYPVSFWSGHLDGLWPPARHLLPQPLALPPEVPHAVSATVVLLIASTGAADAALHASPDGTRGFGTIQAAIDAAADGDTVWVAPAEWMETVFITDKHVVLKSLEGPEVTSIASLYPLRILNEDASGTVIDGFTLRGQVSGVRGLGNEVTVKDCLIEGPADCQGADLDNGSYRFERCTFLDCGQNGIRAYGSELEVVDCRFEANGQPSQPEGAGIRLDVGSLLVERTVFVDNESGSGPGIWIRSAEAVVDRATFHDNVATDSGAFGSVVTVRGFAGVSFSRSIFSESDAHSAVGKAASSATATFDCCVFWRNEQNRTDGFPDPVGDAGNRRIDPIFCDEDAGDLAIAHGSPCDAGQSPDGCGVIGALDPGCGDPGSVWISGRVAYHWGQGTEGAVLEASGDASDTSVTGTDGYYYLNVPPGSYTVTATHPVYNLTPAAREYAALTATETGDDYFPYETPRSWLVDGSGGGDAVTIEEAIELAWPLDSVLVAPGFYEESSGLSLGGKPILVKSLDGPSVTFIDASGHVFWIREGGTEDSIVDGFTLLGDYWSTVRVDEGATLTVRRCVLAGNSHGEGAAVVAGGSLTLEECLVRDVAPAAAGIELRPGFDGSVSRNVFFGNGGPAIVLDADRQDAVTCNAMWMNGDDAIVGGYPMLPGENGNFAADPLFCDAAGGDHHLDAVSPCLPGQDPYGAGCGQVGPFGEGCAVAPPFYAFAVTPSDATYHEPVALEVEGRFFPPTATVTLEADGEPDIPVALDLVSPDLLAGTADLTGARPGLRSVVIHDGSAAYALEEGFEVRPVEVASVTPDALSIDDPPTALVIDGFPFLADVEVRFENPAEEVLPSSIVSRTFDELVVEVDPGGYRSSWDLVLIHPGQDTLRVGDALWIEDQNRALDVPGDYATIPVAIAVAIPGDSVRVGPGEYAGRFTLDRPLVLLSLAGPEETVLTGSGDNVISVVSGGEGSRIEGFTIRDGRSTYAGGGLRASGEVYVVGNRFENNTAFTMSVFHDKGIGGAMYLTGESHVIGNTFVDNRSGLWGGAILIRCENETDESEVRDNLFLHNQSDQGNGIVVIADVVDPNPVLIDGNTFVTSTGWAEIGFDYLSTGVVTRNLFSAEWIYPVVCEVSQPTREGDPDPRRERYVPGRASRGAGGLIVDCNAVHITGGDPMEWEQDLEAWCEIEVTSTFYGDPLFCDPGSGDYRLREDSPIAPGATACGRIGAFEETCPVVIGTDEEASAPVAYALGRLRPNPFNPRLRVPFDVPAPGGEVRIEVFDVNGRRVRSLLREVMPAGRHQVIWDGRAGDLEGGARAASGVYFIRMDAGPHAFIERATLLQ